LEQKSLEILSDFSLAKGEMREAEHKISIHIFLGMGLFNSSHGTFEFRQKARGRHNVSKKWQIYRKDPVFSAKP
jgi:hypothetical protein